MPQDYIDAWDNIADDYESKVGLYPEQQAVISKYFSAPAKVIDVCCGPGRQVVHLAELGYQVTGIDLSEAMVNKCKSLLSKTGLKADAIKCDATNLQFEDNSFDFSFSFNNSFGVIPTHEARLKAISEIVRVTKKRLAVEFLKSTEKEEKTRFHFKNKTNEAVGYPACRWDEEEVLSIFRSHNLKNIKIEKGRSSIEGGYFFTAIADK